MVTMVGTNVQFIGCELCYHEISGHSRLYSVTFRTQPAFKPLQKFMACDSRPVLSDRAEPIHLWLLKVLWCCSATLLFPWLTRLKTLIRWGVAQTISEAHCGRIETNQFSDTTFPLPLSVFALCPLQCTALHFIIYYMVVWLWWPPYDGHTTSLLQCIAPSCLSYLFQACAMLAEAPRSFRVLLIMMPSMQVGTISSNNMLRLA